MKLPRVTGEKTINALKRAGFELDHIEGSHHILRHYERGLRATVPKHSGETIHPKILKSILSQANLTVEEFLELL